MAPSNSTQQTHQILFFSFEILIRRWCEALEDETICI